MLNSTEMYHNEPALESLLTPLDAAGFDPESDMTDWPSCAGNAHSDLPPPGSEGKPLTPADLRRLEERYITRKFAEVAGIVRVDSLTAQSYIGKHGNRDCSGLLIPYLLPGSKHPVAHRVRRDHHEYEAGKPKNKYLSAPGQKNHFYFPPDMNPALLGPEGPPTIVVTEGEWKTLALWRLANEGVTTPRFAVIGLPGVWNWRGTIGKVTDANGERRDETGPISDFDLIYWPGKNTIIAFDADLQSNESVRAAREALAKHVRILGSHAGFLEWEAKDGKGIDDFLANPDRGPYAALDLIQKVSFEESKGWQERLMRSENGKVKNNVSNAITAMQYAPEWAGVLHYDMFKHQLVAVKPTPWGKTGELRDVDFVRCKVWLEGYGMELSVDSVAHAILAVCHEHSVHPIRNELDAITWDGTERLQTWLTTYLGVADTPYSRAVGQRWMISGVARVFQPGCKADCVLVLEGRQGAGKSSALRLLAGDQYFSDQLPDFESKDAQQHLAGNWIVELAEMAAMGRSSLPSMKAFLTAQCDKYRPSYGRVTQEFPRQNIFAASINDTDWQDDPTGGRRFWPVQVKHIDLEALRRDRNQLWAEAKHLYEAGAKWWIDEREEVAQVARTEAAKRHMPHPWFGPIFDYLKQIEGDEEAKLPRLADHRGVLATSTAEILQCCLGKPLGTWNRKDEMAVATCIKQASWIAKREGGRRLYLSSLAGVPADE